MKVAILAYTYGTNAFSNNTYLSRKHKYEYKVNLLQKQELTNVIVIVTRYFGGILLGTGGLVRAYTQCAKTAIDNASIIQQEKRGRSKSSSILPKFREF